MSGQAAGVEPVDRGALRAGLVAFFVDQFDIYLPVLVLGPAAAYFQPADTPAGTAAVLSAAVFAATLVTRPVGAVIFGHVADTMGRKRATMVATGGFGLVTLLMAALPGASTVGLWSIGLLIALRAVNGVFLGGAYTAAVPLTMERTPAARRGVVAGLLLAASPLAYAALGVLSLVLQRSMSTSGPASSYATWGWRIPFVLGAFLAFALLAYYGRTVRELTPPTGPRRRSPLAELLTGRHRRALVQVLVLMTGVWLANNMTSAVMPTLLATRVGLDGPTVSAVMTVESLTVAVTFVACGFLSQRVGRRRFYVGYGVVVAVAGVGAYALLVSGLVGQGGSLGTGGAFLLAPAIGVLTLGVFGPIAAYLTERFPGDVRATGFGVGYSLALVLPAFYPFYLSALAGVMPSYLAPLPLLFLAGALMTVGAAWGPETRGADLSDSGLVRR